MHKLLSSSFFSSCTSTRSATEQHEPWCLWNSFALSSTLTFAWFADPGVLMEFLCLILHSDNFRRPADNGVLRHAPQEPLLCHVIFVCLIFCFACRMHQTESRVSRKDSVQVQPSRLSIANTVRYLVGLDMFYISFFPFR